MTYTLTWFLGSMHKHAPWVSNNLIVINASMQDQDGRDYQNAPRPRVEYIQLAHSFETDIVKCSQNTDALAQSNKNSTNWRNT